MTLSTSGPWAPTVVSLFSAVVLWFGPQVRAGAGQDFRVSPRFDRFLPLSESFRYGDSGSYDMTIWLPGGGGKKPSGPRLRLWMKTGATQPEIEFSGRKRHAPVGKSPQDPSWVDFGVVDRTGEEFGNGFACMRVFGLTAAEASTSYVVFTAQTEVQLSGSIRDAERALCGIARDEGCLDFAAGSDHAEYFSDNEWLWMQDLSNRFNEEGRFVTLNGYERAGDQGHWNFYTSADRLELFRGMNTDPDKNTLPSACARLSHRPDVVAGPHVHHGRFPSEFQPSVPCFHELYSMWGNYEKLTYDILNRGIIIGVTGGGDNHEARGGFSCEDPAGQGTTSHTFAPGLKWKTGLTAALMSRLGRQELVRALRERQTYATTSPRILVDFSVSGASMGGECRVERDAPTITGAIHGVSRVARVEIIRDGQTVQSIEGDSQDMRVKWSDSAVAPGRHWYLLKVIQTDREMAWTSPIWVDREQVSDRE